MPLITPSAGLRNNWDSTPTSSVLTARPCLIDGDYSTICEMGGTYESVGVDFGSEKEVGSIKLTVVTYTEDITTVWYNETFDDFYIYTSSDNSTWTLQETIEGPEIIITGAKSGYIILTLTTPLTARFFKVYAGIGWVIINDTSPDNLRVNEIEFFTPTTIAHVDTIDLTLAPGDDFSFLPILMPSAALAVEGKTPVMGFVLHVASPAELTVTPISSSIEYAFIPESAALTLLCNTPAYIWNIPASQRPAAQIIYTCTLTGDGESPALSDLVLPMSSFQARMRDGDPSYLGCVIPNCMVYADEITARANGDIVVKKGYRFSDGSVQLEEIARVDFESVRIDQGARSASATISGHKTTSSSNSKEVTVQGVSYYCLQADGKRRVRALLDLFLRIGDNCIYGSNPGDKMIVGYITYTVSTTQTLMEVVEA